jgi:hypothetical protein
MNISVEVIRARLAHPFDNDRLCPAISTNGIGDDMDTEGMRAQMAVCPRLCGLGPA